VNEKNDKNLLRQVFLNPTTRNLLAVWSLLKGTTFDLKVIADMLSLTEDGLEAKIQTLAGLGLIQLSSRSTGERVVKFLPVSDNEVSNTIQEMLQTRRREFEAVEARVRSCLYITLLSSTQ
jgi:hypothetical protein